MEEKNNKNALNDFVRNMFKVGTPECALFCGIVALIVAILLITIGFWKTVLVAAIVAVGMLLGGIPAKGEKIRTLVDKIVPKKETVTYTKEEMRKYTQYAQAEAPAVKPEETAAPAMEETASVVEEAAEEAEASINE